MQPKSEGRFDELIQIDCVADIGERQANIDSAVKRGLPQCVLHKQRKGKVAIVGSGPSVTNYVDILKGFDGEIWGINRSFEWMRHRGVSPTAFIGIDPEWFLKECIPNPSNDVTYYIATQVHPGVLDHLEGRNVKLWSLADSQVKHPDSFPPIYGGTTALSRAPNLAWLLGYREVHIFGGDSSYTHKTHVHGGELPSNTVVAQINGISFKTTKTMMSQACEFIEQMVEWARMQDPLSVTLYGEGLMQELYRETLESGSYERYLSEQAGSGLNRKQRRAMRKRAA